MVYYRYFEYGADGNYVQKDYNPRKSSTGRLDFIHSTKRRTTLRCSPNNIVADDKPTSSTKPIPSAENEETQAKGKESVNRQFFEHIAYYSYLEPDGSMNPPRFKQKGVLCESLFVPVDDVNLPEDGEVIKLLPTNVAKSKEPRSTQLGLESPQKDAVTHRSTEGKAKIKSSVYHGQLKPTNVIRDPNWFPEASARLAWTTTRIQQRMSETVREWFQKEFSNAEPIDIPASNSETHSRGQRPLTVHSTLRRNLDGMSPNTIVVMHSLKEIKSPVSPPSKQQPGTLQPKENNVPTKASSPHTQHICKNQGSLDDYEYDFLKFLLLERLSDSSRL